MTLFTAPEDSLTAIRFLDDANEPGVLAIIVDAIGPSYRPIGAMMAIAADGNYMGSLSSGCIEKDIVLNAKIALESSAVTTLRYGLGSNILDLELPCGGGLVVLLVPNPPQKLLATIVQESDNRRPVTLEVADDGKLTVIDSSIQTEGSASQRIRLLPDLRFILFGKGNEVTTFARLVDGLGYSQVLCSPDEAVLEIAAEVRCECMHLKAAHWPRELRADPWTAILLFFHDHEWEPPILARALREPSHFIGAQGSRKSADARKEALHLLAPHLNLSKLMGPIGLIPSTRDAKTLAISVLAEVLAQSKNDAYEDHQPYRAIAS